MEWLRRFLNSDHVPRWQIIAFGLVVIGTTWLQQWYFYEKTLADSHFQAQQERVEAKLLEVQRHSVEFQTYAGAFVSAVLDDSEDISGKRAALIDNILAQDAAIDVSMALFDESTQSAVSEYRAALRDMRAAVDNVTDVISMNAFWESASDLLVARNALLEALEQQVSGISS